MTYVTCYICRISTKWEYRLASYIYLPTYVFEFELIRKRENILTMLMLLLPPPSSSSTPHVAFLIEVNTWTIVEQS